MQKKSPGGLTPELSSIQKIVFENQVRSGLRRSLAFFPGHDDIAGSFVTEGFDGSILVEILGTISYDGYLLSSCFFTFLDGDRFEAWQCTERRTDVLFTPTSRYAGHAGNICDVLSHCHWGKSKNRQRHGCDKFFHGIDSWCRAKYSHGTTVVYG